MGIYRSLHTLITDPLRVDLWIGQPNPAAPFDGRAPAELIFSGSIENLALVRHHLNNAIHNLKPEEFDPDYVREPLRVGRRNAIIAGSLGRWRRD
jgi:hypothetical protein